LDLSLPGPRYLGPQQQKRFYGELVARLKPLAGVETVGATSQRPVSAGDNWGPAVIDGRPAP